MFPSSGSETRAKEKDPEEVKTDFGTRDSEVDVDQKRASKAVQFGEVPVITPILPLNRTHSDVSLTTTIPAALEVEEHDKVGLNHLFPQSPNINTVRRWPLHT